MDDHAQVALQNLRENVAHIAYVHVHSHLIMVDTQREHTRSPPLSLVGRRPPKHKKCLLLLGLFLHFLNGKTLPQTRIRQGALVETITHLVEDSA